MSKVIIAIRLDIHQKYFTQLRKKLCNNKISFKLMTWWSTYTVSECSNEKKLITERLTLSLQTIYHFVLFIHFFVSNRRPSARPLQLSCRLLVRSIDVVWKAQMRVVDAAAARNTAKVDVLVGLANVEHFGALVSGWNGEKSFYCCWND